MGYLRDHGVFDGNYNNQLLCFDPCSCNWKNPEGFGTVPEPRRGQATTIIGYKVWMYGGHFHGGKSNELFHLDMTGLTWTEIRTGQAKLFG